MQANEPWGLSELNLPVGETVETVETVENAALSAPAPQKRG